MKKTLLISVFSLFFLFKANSQTNSWKSVKNSSDFVKNKMVSRSDFPENFLIFETDFQKLKSNLLLANDRFSNNAKPVIVEIPNAIGNIEKFQVFESSNFDAQLQSQFPEIRSYSGIGITDKTAQIKLTFDPRGVQTMIVRADKPTEFIEPFTNSNTIYAVYSSQRVKGKMPFTCSTDDVAVFNGLAQNVNTSNTARTSTASFLQFRLALSCTAEYANFFGATSSAQYSLVLAAYNATIGRVNGVFEKDFAIRLVIISQTSNVTYYDTTTDPYSGEAIGTDPANTDNNLGWNIQLQNTLSSSLTGVATALATNNAAYDVGHLFGGDGGGGNAGCIGCVCTADVAGDNKNKGSGYTSPSNGVPAGDTFDIDYVAHELGHQFGGNHTFTHSTENNSVNYEPGSGSTIMGYAGITLRNIQPNSDAYFHACSIAQVQANMTTKMAGGGLCASTVVSSALSHGVPVANAGANFTIPRSTPFMLTGTSTDTGGTSTHTYCWEQYDEATTAAMLCGDTNVAGDTDCIPLATKTTGANFRSYLPSASPIRRFPRIESSLAGLTTTTAGTMTTEALSSVARILNFRLTVRDNIANGGLTNFDDVLVTVANIAPLNITSQNTTGIVYNEGSTQTVTWSNAGNSTIAGGANVDILFSNDNGVTWTTLLANTTNDGSQAVTLTAGLTGAYCRFMVKANANIFYNVTTKSFAVGNYVYQTQNTCSDYVFNFGDLAIQEDGASFTGYNMNVPDSFLTTDANIRVELSHADVGTVFLGLRPAHLSTGVTQYFNGLCDGNANMNLYFDDAGTAVNCGNTTSGAATLPGTTFSTYNGNQANGNWIFFITDINVDGTIGTIQRATLNLCKSESVPVLASNTFTAINDLKVYPNPNKGNFTIDFNALENETSVKIHDLRGRQVYSNSYNATGLFNENISLNNTQAGIYLVTITNGDRKEVKKIVIE